MSSIPRFFALGALLAVVAAPGVAAAALVSQTLAGSVTQARTVEGSLLVPGAPVSLTITYESSLVPAAGSTVLGLGAGAPPGTAFVFDLAGLLPFDLLDEVDVADGFPSVLFVDGIAVAIDYLGSRITAIAGLPVALALSIDGLDWTYRSGNTVLAAGSLTPVPVPAALPLLATAIAGLALWRRRQKVPPGA